MRGKKRRESDDAREKAKKRESGRRKEGGGEGAAERDSRRRAGVRAAEGREGGITYASGPVRGKGEIERLRWRNCRHDAVCLIYGFIDSYMRDRERKRKGVGAEKKSVPVEE